MPPTSVSLKQIRKMFHEIKRITKNFRELQSEILQDNASRILVFRLALCMSQNEFERNMGLANKNISKYETGKIQHMRPNTARQYASKILMLLEKAEITEEKTIMSFKRMSSESNGFLKANQGTEKVLLAQRKGAMNSLGKRFTAQEKNLKKLLELNGFVPEINFALDREKAIITDVFLKEPFVAIECKEIISENRRQIKEQIRNLAYQGYKIKFNFPAIKLAAFVICQFKLSLRDMQELKGPYDFVSTDVGGADLLSFSRSQYGLNSLGLHAAYNAPDNGMRPRKGKPIS